MSVLTAIHVLQYTLVLMAVTGCLLCVGWVHVSFRDVQIIRARGENGGKKIANLMRLKMAGLLLGAFLAFLLIGLVDMTPLQDVKAHEEFWGRMVRGRLEFNVAVLLLLLVVWVAYRDRKKLDAYYDGMAAGMGVTGDEQARIDAAAASQKVATAAQHTATVAQEVATTAQEEASAKLSDDEQGL